MRKLLTSKAGVTLLEGVIALGLLALVAGGAFGVLLSASRQNTQPDVREEMVWAVEKAYNKLKAYVGNLPSGVLPENMNGGLCGGDNSPLSVSPQHDISCLLPPICDRNRSSFSYVVSTRNLSTVSAAEANLDSTGYDISFTIQCNGYKL